MSIERALALALFAGLVCLWSVYVRRATVAERLHLEAEAEDRRQDPA